MKNRVRLLDFVFYFAFGLGSVMFYYKRELLGESWFFLLVGVWVVGLRFMDFLLWDYKGGLKLRESEVVTVSKDAVEFFQGATGYRFSRDAKDIEKVSYSEFLGVPTVSVCFKGGEAYSFKWFENSKVLYEEIRMIAGLPPG